MIFAAGSMSRVDYQLLSLSDLQNPLLPPPHLLPHSEQKLKLAVSLLVLLNESYQAVTVLIGKASADFVSWMALLELTQTHAWKPAISSTFPF